MIFIDLDDFRRVGDYFSFKSLVKVEADFTSLDELIRHKSIMSHVNPGHSFVGNNNDELRLTAKFTDNLNQGDKSSRYIDKGALYPSFDINLQQKQLK